MQQTAPLCIHATTDIHFMRTVHTQWKVYGLAHVRKIAHRLWENCDRLERRNEKLAKRKLNQIYEMCKMWTATTKNIYNGSKIRWRKNKYVCVWQLPIFNGYITKRWDIGQRWQSTPFTELIPNVVLILNWAASFPLPSSLVLVSIKKRFRTAWCATKQSNSTQNLLKYPSRSVSFIHLVVWWIRIGVCG